MLAVKKPFNKMNTDERKIFAGIEGGSNYFFTVARLLLGGLFFFSGFSKIIAPSSSDTLLSQIFVSATTQQRQILTTLFSLFEILLGGLLFFKRFLVQTLFATSLFFIFALLFGFLFLSNPVECGCFGGIISSKTDETFLIRNFVLLGISLLLFYKASHCCPRYVE
jgi:uncharacterized membrane protein YphA (DoxX/SURF4 family)